VHEQIAAPPWESVTAIQDRALAGAREALGSRYTTLFAQGQRLSAEQAIAATPHHPAPVAAGGAR
jgi:hypothetical protein